MRDRHTTTRPWREQQVNDAMHRLDEMHRTYRIERDEYRRRRRQLLESLSDPRDTVRRAVRVGDVPSVRPALERNGAGQSARLATRGRGVAARRVVMLVVLPLVMVAAAAGYWLWTTA